MENAADALKIAASVLIFVLALSISINAFSQARVASQTVLEYSDREYDYTYVENNGGTERIVGAETVIPSIYKAYRENYKIVFKNLEGGVFQRKDDSGNWQDVDSIDLQQETLGSETQKAQFILAILYGRACNTIKNENFSYDMSSFNFSQFKADFENNSRIRLYDEGIYGKINGRNLRENIGVYYQEEVGDDGVEDSSNVPEANMTTKRVITYTLL